MRINELFDRPVEWELATSRSDVYEYEFRLEDKLYYVDFEDPVDGVWRFNFGFMSGGEGQTGIMGTGYEYEVFSTVIEIVQDFLQRVNPNGLMFTAKELSRKKLYNRMIKRVPGNYKIASGEMGGMKFYYIYRPDFDINRVHPGIKEHPRKKPTSQKK